MCGIGSITLTKTASPKISGRHLNLAVSVLLDALDHRGGDACGVLSIRHDGRCHIVKAPLPARAFNNGRGTIPADTRAIAVHTRFATSGSAGWNRNNHPVAAGGALVLHNGVIWDWRQPAQIVHPEPEVDTYLLAKAAAGAADRKKGENAQTHAERIAQALLVEEGSAAVQIAYRGRPFLLSAALHDSPLYHAEAEGIRITASTYIAVQDTFNALGITLPTVPYSYQKQTKKAKKERPAAFTTISTTRAAIYNAAEGTVLVWDAGTHTAGAITIPKTTRYTPAWQTYTKPANTDLWDDDAGYEKIATKLLKPAAGEIDWERCDICNDWTHPDDQHPLFGGTLCNDCAHDLSDDNHQAHNPLNAPPFKETPNA